MARDGMTLHAEVRGDGPPVVLLHGWPVSSRMWEGQLERLSDELTVVAPDLPGFGRSPREPSSSLADLAAAVDRFLAARAPERVLLAGWSMGAGVVMRYCELFGCDRLVGVALVEDSPRLRPAPDWPAGEYTTFSDEQVEIWFAAWEEGRRQEVLSEMFSFGFARPELHGAEIASLVEQGLLADAAAALESFRDAIECDFRAGLAELSVPALLVYGAHSRMSTPPVHDYMRRTIPDAELHSLTASGHCPMYEQPRLFDDLLRGFARRAFAA